MRMNSILFAIAALLVVMAFAGNAAAAAEPVSGQVSATDAQGQTVALWVETNQADYVTIHIQDGGIGNPDFYGIGDIQKLLSRNGVAAQGTYNLTVAMFCSGHERDIDGNVGPAYTNTYYNDAGVIGGPFVFDGNPKVMPMLNVEPCPIIIDLNVSEISVNPSCKPGVLRSNTTNEICAKIVNDGTAAAGQFNVSFVVTGSSGGYSKEVSVTGLGAGNNTTVCITDYQPTSPGAVTINVTADCNLAVGESDEGNNSMVESATVYNSGYMGKRLTGGEDIVLVTKEEGNIDLKYAVCNATTYINGTGTQHDFGDNQTYLSGSTYPNWIEYRARWDKDPQLPTPSGETIRKATLYVYYSTSYYPIPDFNVSFNGMNYTMANAVHRTDVKGWPSTSAYSNAPSGMLTYDVTSEFDNTTNTMVVYNLKEPGPDKVTLQGAVLAVVYEHGDEPDRIIYVNEGFDLLVSTYYSCCTPDEATAYADFLNVPNPALFVNATLVTISTGATKGPGMNKLFFNNDEWDGGLNYGTFPTEEGWAPPAVTSWTDITANETDVLGSLLEGSNTARFQDSGDLLCMANAFLKLEKGEGLKPDLNVSEISVNPSCGAGVLFGNESNNISAVVKNIGSDDAGASHVSFVLNGYSETVTVSALAAGANETVCITDPTIRNAGDAVTITVTADYNSEVGESDELNNASTLDTTVVNNGYKSKTYTGGENITTLATYDLNGSLVYSAGDSYYLSAYYNPGWTTYDVAWTAGDLPVPGTAAIKEARLYVIYTSDKASVMPNEVTLSFNGVAQTYDVHYSDRKGYDGYDSPYGMLTYNVTSNFSTAGNIANLTNNHLGGANASMRGMMLVAIYEDANEPQRQIFVNEDFDLLYGGSSKCTTPDEATAYAPITGPAIDMSNVADARLITFAPGADGSGSAGEGELIFNGEVWNDEWTDNEVHQIGVSDRDVTSYLQSIDNLVGFQSNGDYMEASNAFLVVTFGSIPGDVNGDGYLTTTDATIVLQMAVHGEYSDMADVSGDGAVTSLDALMILQAVDTEF